MKFVNHIACRTVMFSILCGVASTVGSEPRPTKKVPSVAHHRKAYFGELHVHSKNSFDSYFNGVRVSPDDAYRFGRGESIPHFGGKMVQLNTPLDFMAVTDHAMYLGILPKLDAEDNPLGQLDVARRIRSTEKKIEFSELWRILFPGENEEPDLPRDLVDESVRSTWREYATLADRYYQPGVFTTLVGYEWTAATDNKGLHRNIIFRSTTDLPAAPFSILDSINPEDLWDWMDAVRASGTDLLAIPHNPNQSDGLMFPYEQWDGSPLDRDWSDQRTRNEPVVEVTQIKGTSETTPVLSPNDEWAAFEIFDERMGTGGIRSNPHGSYVRDAYLRGLEVYSQRGFNPYVFGMIGSSDGHNSNSPIEENNYTGKMLNIDGTPILRRTGGSGIARHNWSLSASGLAGVWSEENSREAIYDALERREVFATSGTRIKVRMFGGWDYPSELIEDPEWISIAYRDGVSMGNELPQSEDAVESAPAFIVRAIKDPSSAWLQRIQIIKGWIDNGEAKQQVYDVACSDSLTPDPVTHRCPDNLATVDTKTCDYSKSSGDVELAVRWADPNFSPDQYSFYYARVIENPTCRWTTWDANRMGLPLLDTVPATIQERAWSSPIWYRPDS
ncbi:MAG: DUF3604 domain-containing protein [Acidobacteriota bacterium]|nr:MAG: DUF3604 domain-containing protein [Acidobacteriota bacterium]